jgi:preprotein translocase subunit SecY
LTARLWSSIDKRALVVTAGCIAAWRLIEQIPVADLSPAFVQTRLELYSQPGFFAAIGSSSIPFSAYSIGYEGIGPYVDALVIVSLVGAVSSGVRAMYATDEGRLSLTRWTRGLALVLAVGQGYGWTVLAQSIGALPPLDWSARLFVCTELTAGTAVMILLAGAMDEFGLGFGYAAFLFYGLRIIGDALHRFGDLVAANPSFEAATRAIFVGSVWTVAACAVCVAVVLASRRVADREIPVLVGGVFRPAQFAFAFLFLPALVTNYYTSTDVYAIRWFLANWAPLGPAAWLDAVYIGLECALIMAFAVFVAAYDRLVTRPEAGIWRVVQRLAVIAGGCDAVLVVFVPIAAQLVERRVGMLVPLGGFSLLIVVLLTLIVVRAIENRPLRLASLFP